MIEPIHHWRRQLAGLSLLLVFLSPSLVQAKGLKPGSLVTRNLSFQTELAAIYLGDFPNARLERDSSALSLIVSSYLRAFGKMCRKYLPRNKVEITFTECAREQVTRNGYGIELSRQCTDWRRVGTGIYANPALYASSSRLEARSGVKLFAHALANDPFAIRSMGDDAVSLGDDLTVLIKQNGCARAALRRFEKNLFRFVEGKPPLKLPGAPTIASLRKPRRSRPAKSIAFQALFNDLILENSKTWMFNRYVPDSILSVRVTREAADGSPLVVTATYRFLQLGNSDVGKVTLHFARSVPQCLFFFDAPQTCRHPSRRIIANFENGQYAARR